MFEVTVDLDELMAWLDEQPEINYNGSLFRRGRQVTYCAEGRASFLTMAAIAMQKDKGQTHDP